MIRHFKFVAFFFLLFFLIANKTFAESSYVLPYPSRMPGSLSYKIHLIYENVSKYWHFGNFGQFEYNLKMADKYLVQAKTLFDYKQHLLGFDSLKKSNYYFNEILPSLNRAEKESKNISPKKSVLRKASRKHIEYLEKIDVDTPDIFIWEPEKSSPTTLLLKKILMDSINIRKDSL